MSGVACSRRGALLALAGAADLAASFMPVLAGEARIARPIGEAQTLPTISWRIDFISRALIDTRYRAHRLIGSPHRPEHLVVRDHVFGCMTCCETMLGVAVARKPAAFVLTLCAIRYDHGVMSSPARNNYLFL